MQWCSAVEKKDESLPLPNKTKTENVRERDVDLGGRGFTAATAGKKNRFLVTALYVPRT